MPYYGDSDPTPSAPLTDASPTITQMQGSAQSVYPTDSGTPVGNTLGMAALALPDLVDTVASNKYLQPITGINRGDVNDAALSAAGMPGITDFYNQHRQGIETMSGIGGMVAAGVLTDNLVTGPLMETLSTIPYAKRIASLDQEYTAAMGTVRSADLAMAARGSVGQEAYAGTVTADAMRFDSKVGEFVTEPGQAINRASAVFKAKGIGALVGIRNAAVVEAVGYSALNSNGFLYSDDAQQNVMNQILGLTAAGGLGWFQGAYQIRKAVNSDEMKRAFANALDPTGEDEQRLLWQNRPGAAAPMSAAEGFMGGQYTDQITSLMSQATTLKNAPVEGTDDARTLLANREKLATQNEQLSLDAAQKLTTKGITTDGRTRFSMDTPEVGNHLQMIIHTNANDLYGVEMLGQIPDETGGALQLHLAHQARLEERVQQAEDLLADPNTSDKDSAALTQLRQRLGFEQNLTPFTFVDGERGPISNATALEGFQEPQIKFTSAGGGQAGLFGRLDSNPGLLETFNPGSDAPVVSLDTGMTLHLPGNKDLLTTADHYDVLKAYRLGNDLADRLSKWTAPIPLPENPTSFQLDLAQEVLKRNPDAQIIWPQGMTQDSAQVESLAQKSDAMSYWRSKLQASATAPDSQLDPDGLMNKLRVRFNLPKLTAYEQGLSGQTQTPVDQLMRGVSAMGSDALREMPLQDVKESVAAYKRIGDLTPVTGRDVESLAGNSFTYGLDESGNPIKPLFGYARSITPAQYTPDYITNELASRQALRMSIMTGQDAAPLTQSLTQSVLENPDTQIAGATHTLMDQQIQGNLSGSAPQSFWGTLRNEVASTDWIGRDAPAILAASRLQDTVKRVAGAAMKAIFDGAFGGNLNQLANPRNAGSKLLLDQFHSFAGGWDIKPKAITRDGGYHAFELADTQQNQSRWKQLFGGDMPTGSTLMSPQGKEVVLDSLGMDLQNRFNTVSKQLLSEKNTLLRANGLPQIQERGWYIPPPNTKGKYVGFTIGPDGKTVPGMGAVGNSPQQYAARKEQVMELLKSKGLGYVFRDQDDIANFGNMFDKAQMDFVDPGVTAAQPGHVSLGSLRGPVVDTNAFNESLQTVRDAYLRHAQDVLETVMKPQVDSATARAAMSTNVVKNKLLGNLRYNSVHDIYLQALLGKSKLQSDGSIFGKFYNPAEGFINEGLNAATPIARGLGDSLTNVWDATNGWINRANPWSATPAANKDFATLTEKLGPHMPFDSAAQLMEQRGISARPWTSTQVGAKFNQFAAGAILRFMEVAQPLIHLSTIVNAMPAVLRHYSPMEGEAVEDYASRIGHSATIFNLPDGSAIGVPDMAKMGAAAFRRAWSASSEPDFDYMVKRGYIKNEVAEFHQQFGAIDSKDAWQRFFGGDQSIGKPANLQEAFMKKGLANWMSTLTDNSYDFTRSWGHMAGLELADNLGITGVANRNEFAHDVANKMIANYAPHNRPAMFQGAMGSTIGLFQSFMQEYYQRMFRYAETGDIKSLVSQYVMQSSMFGINSIPGWKEYNDFMSKVGTQGDPRSNLQHRLGQNAGDLIQNGILSNIPTLFGQPGVALYTRGDANPNVPGFSTPPVVSILGKVAAGVGQGIQAFRDSIDGTLTKTQLVEIVANMMPNRPIAGMIQQLGDNGDQVDSQGQLVSDTKSAMEAAYRMIGIKSQRQEDEVNAFYANKGAQQQKASQDAMLRLATRAALRGGNEDALPAIFAKYQENGGDPRQFSKWLKENYQAATSTRGQRQLENAMKNPEQAGYMARLLDSGVSVNQDAQTPDPAETYQSAGSGDELNQSSGGLGNYSGQMTVQQPGNATVQ